MTATATLPGLPGVVPVAGFGVIGATHAPVVPMLSATTAPRRRCARRAGWQLLAFNVGLVA